MIRAFLSLFTKPNPYARALQARDDAWQAYLDAKYRGDTRDKHRAAKALRYATHDLLRVELGR